MISIHLLPDYDVSDDSASFLTSVIHFAKHSIGCVTIADVLLPGAPLIYVNDKFIEMTGYSLNEVLGRNCRFLQGPDTEPQMVASIQASMKTGRDAHVVLTNYKKSGTKFANLLSLRPVHDSR
eukprot:3773265-Prymnesium_polylepis.1